MGITIFPVGAIGRAKADDKPVPATLKLPGGDWLFGKVTSGDGENFSVRLDDGTPVAVTRPQIEWVQFGQAPAPAFGFSGTMLDMEGWLPQSAAMDLAGQTLTVKGTQWIGRSISPPKRFELSFELPEDSEEGTQLWLQPFGPMPNCYGPGTVEIRFGKKEISRNLFIDKFDQQTSPLSKEAQQDKGPAKYRVFYDGGEKRIVVQRNGRLVGDWKFFDKKEKDPPVVNAEARDFQFNVLAFDRDDRMNGIPVNRDQTPHFLKFNRLRFQPWDGTVPKEGDAEDGQDRLSDGEAALLSGKLEYVTETDLRLSGELRGIHDGAFIQFSNPPSGILAGAEAKVTLGRKGEFIVRNLEIRDGKLHGETAFANALDLPLSALRTIAFPAPAPAPAPVDLLVFKNGDELRGKALSAALGGPVRWRTSSGQEVEFQPARLAGLRLAGSTDAADGKPAESGVVVELRTGEKLRGKLMAFDEKQVRLQHPQLGPVAVDRSRLWRLFPNPQFEGIDGARAPGGWAWAYPPGGQKGDKTKSADSEPVVYLDGTYIARGQENSGSFSLTDLPGLQHEMKPALDRFELRVQATTPGTDASNFVLVLEGKDDTGLNAFFSYNQLQMMVMNSRFQPRRGWRNIPLDEKLGDSNTRRALRLFVDTKAGTCDVVVNGVHLVRLGQEASERLLKSQYTVRIAPYPGQEMPTILSNLWIGPWSGDLPQTTAADEGGTALANGDVVPRVPKAMHEGKFTIESELGDLDLPVEKALAVDFGGAIDEQRAAARIRLADGSAVNVDAFHWDGHELAAHSLVLGEVRLPAEAVHELIFDPPLPRPPANVAMKKTAQQNPPDDQ